MPMSRCRGGTSWMVRPFRRIAPAVGASKPASIIKHVVLPDPEEPKSVRNSPSWTLMCRSRTTLGLATIALVYAVELDVGVSRCLQVFSVHVDSAG